MKDIFKIIGGVGIYLVIVYGLSWLITCGLIKLITVCFGWAFKLSIATGIWLITVILRSIFKSTTTVKTK